MKFNKKLVFSIVFFLIMLSATFYILFKDNDISQIMSIIKTVNFNYLILPLVLVLLYFAFEAIYIYLTLKSLKVKTDFKKCFSYSCIEYYFSAITPSSTGGQPFQSYYMAKDGVAVTKSSIALLLNTITFKIVLLILGIFCILLKPSLIFSNGSLFNFFLILGFIINTAVIIICFMIIKSKNKVKKVCVWIIKLLAKLHIKKDPTKTINKIDEYMEEYKNSANYVTKHKSVVFKILIYTLFQRLCMFSIAYFVYLSFGLNTYTFLDFLTIQVAIAIAIDSLPFPGGMGVTEIMMLKIYTPIYGESFLTASIVLTRVCNFYTCLILSGIISLANHLRVTFLGCKKEEVK